MDLIEIDALRLRCVIGCQPEERRDRSDVVIDLRIGTDAGPAGLSDELADAWNYRTAVKAVIALVEGSACRTVEAMATMIARLLVIDHHAPHVRAASIRSAPPVPQPTAARPWPGTPSPTTAAPTVSTWPGSGPACSRSA